MKEYTYKNLILKEYDSEVHLILNNKKIGYAIFKNKKDFLHLDNLKIKEEFRNNNFGELLICFLQLKNKPILLEVLYPRVINFYKRLQFEIDGDENSYRYDNKKISKEYLKKLNYYKVNIKESNIISNDFSFGMSF